uniref:hypothetical protein n=1 Tax=Drosera capensis TaxID=4366 RepID=UPI0024116E93|nr:hypothetical protein P8577_pgp054 [Drosera capensis]YP_010737262.1 hypothetical protein P8577_pgp002 [Drosera capensis]WEQ03469.1 hypothetical protein [Drosera capensis]WEQ03521.1 hypothetical protein [Drosera capensis]
MRTSFKRIYYVFVIKVSQVIIEILFQQQASKIRFLVVGLSEQMYQSMYGYKSVDKTRIKEVLSIELKMKMERVFDSFVIYLQRLTNDHLLDLVYYIFYSKLECYYEEYRKLGFTINFSTLLLQSSGERYKIYEDSTVPELVHLLLGILLPELEMELGLGSRILPRNVKLEIELDNFIKKMIHRALIRFIDYALKNDDRINVLMDRIKEEIVRGIREKANNKVHAIETSLERVFTIVKEYLSEGFNKEAAFSLFYKILREEVGKVVIQEKHGTRAKFFFHF